MSNIASGVNKAIRINLTRKGMTQKELADRAGMRLQYLNHRLNEHQSWSIDDLDAVAEALGIGRAIDLLQLADLETASQRLAA